jgi:hypothetical protein
MSRNERLGARGRGAKPPASCARAIPDPHFYRTGWSMGDRAQYATLLGVRLDE